MAVKRGSQKVDLMAVKRGSQKVDLTAERTAILRLAQPFEYDDCKNLLCIHSQMSPRPLLKEYTIELM